jgi:hypothetical protein
MGETPDQLRQEVDRKREDAGQKVDALEQRMTETVQRVRDGVTETTEQVRATVQDSVEGVQQAVGQTAQQVTEQVKATTQQVTEQVKENFNLRRQIEERPLVMLGAALLGGFVIGSVTGGDDDGHGGSAYRARDMPGYSYGGPYYGGQMAYQHGTSYQPSESGTHDRGAGMGGAAAALGGAGLMAGLRNVVQSSGLQDTLTNSASAVLGNLGERIKSTLEEQIPGFAEQMKQQGQGGQDGQQGTSGQASQESSSSQSGRFGQEPAAATTDAAGRTPPYFGSQEGQTSTGSSPSVAG